MKMLVFNTFRNLLLLKISCRSSKTHHQNGLLLLQIASFSSKRPLPTLPLPYSSPCVDFLIDSCGLSSEQALQAAMKINNKMGKHFNSEAAKPRSVISFFETNGFSKTQISKIISTLPGLLFSSVEKNIKPKIKFFQDLGLSDSNVAGLISSNPRIMERSLKCHIIPHVEYIKRFILKGEAFLASIGSVGVLLGSPWSRYLVRNVDYLRENGVSDADFGFLMNTRYSALRASPEMLKLRVEKIQRYGFEPQSRRFAVAVFVMYSMSVPTWDSKVDLLKSCGWSEEQIYGSFRRAPIFMAYSVAKLKEAMTFYKEHLDWGASVTSQYPRLLMFNIERRVIPRYVVCKILTSKGIVKKDKALIQMLNLAEVDFLRKYVVKYQNEIPELLDKYKNGSMLGGGKEGKLAITV